MVRIVFAFHRRAGISQRVYFGMRLSCFWVEAAAHYSVIFDEDAADLGVGSCGLRTYGLGQVQGLSHEVEVVCGGAAVVCNASAGRDEAVRSDEK